MKKAKKVLLIVFIIVISLVCVTGYLVFRPADVRQESVKYFRLSEAGDSSERLFEHMKKGFNRLKNSNTLRQQFLSDYEKLPTDEKEDYVEVVFLFEVKNKSPFVTMNDVQVVFDDMESEINPYLYTKIVPETVNIQPRGKDTLVLSAYLFVDDMTDADVERLLKGMTVEVSSDIAGIWNVGRKIAINDDINCENIYFLE